MKAADAALDLLVVHDIATRAKVRRPAVRHVLGGHEVWPKTYKDVVAAATDLGVTDIPPLAPRASRCHPVEPCAECVRLRVENVGLATDVHKAAVALMAKDAECDGLRAELAELRAANVPPPAPTPAPTAPTSVAEVVPKVVRERVPPPRRLHILLDGAEVAPEATPGESDSATG